jgi:predicted regulator of Ras-like GTPase activity (Roadblock/LC7/MglB family)
MDSAQALVELMQLSSQVEVAAILGPDGGVIASSPEGQESEGLAAAALELVGVAFELGTRQEVTRVEVELADGAVFVLREEGRTIAARTGPEPASGLVVYDLRTCLRSIEEEPKKRRSSKKQREGKEKEGSE